MGPLGCSFCPRPTATSFLGNGRARTSPPAQEEKKRIEEHCVPCPSNHPAAAFPLHRQIEGYGPHEEIVDHPSSFAGPILYKAPFSCRLVAQVAEEEAATQDGHPNGDPEPDTPEPGGSGNTQAGK